jgi:hypothetical protein
VGGNRGGEQYRAKEEERTRVGLERECKGEGDRDMDRHHS